MPVVDGRQRLAGLASLPRRRAFTHHFKGIPSQSNQNSFSVSCDKADGSMTCSTKYLRTSPSKSGR